MRELRISGLAFEGIRCYSTLSLHKLNMIEFRSSCLLRSSKPSIGLVGDVYFIAW